MNHEVQGVSQSDDESDPPELPCRDDLIDDGASGQYSRKSREGTHAFLVHETPRQHHNDRHEEVSQCQFKRPAHLWCPPKKQHLHCQHGRAKGVAEQSRWVLPYDLYLTHEGASATAHDESEDDSGYRQHDAPAPQLCAAQWLRKFGNIRESGERDGCQ